MSADEYPSIFSRQMEAIVYRYHDVLANENAWTALCNDVVLIKIDTAQEEMPSYSL